MFSLILIPNVYQVFWFYNSRSFSETLPRLSGWAPVSSIYTAYFYVQVVLKISCDALLVVRLIPNVYQVYGFIIVKLIPNISQVYGFILADHGLSGRQGGISNSGIKYDK